ncbi:SOS response-associated peptidase family protein [Bdellovibrio sp. GT3]|uniref:SOS response-associated peptidase family protein n=1 Tax=Bdellovibrio sp. GT3 TaxID=3136282 RepID=UPI0030F2ADEE
MVKQQIRKLGIKYDARIDYELFQEMFYRRLTDERIKICKALEAEFDHPENNEDKEISKLIQAYRKLKLKDLEEHLRFQGKRMHAAELSLSVKETKKALNEKRISTDKIEYYSQRIKGIQRTELIPTDSRVFPMTFAPIIVRENDQNIIKLARYHCRPSDKPESIDVKYNGLYNARRDNLGNAFWKDLYLHKHGFFVVESFYENVSKADYERRSLKDGEKDTNMVLQFSPKDRSDLLIACLYDYWESGPSDGFYSFAALTHEPTSEVREAGHDRLIIALQEQNLGVWMEPERYGSRAIETVLDSPASHVYEHVISSGA